MMSTFQYFQTEAQYSQHDVPQYNPSDWYRPPHEPPPSAATTSGCHRPVNAGQVHNSQIFPPPPPGPPPSSSSNNLARMHSVVKEIAIQPQTYDFNSPALAFRQTARTQPPLPLKNRDLALAGAPKIPPIPASFRLQQNVPPPLQVPSGHHARKPAPLKLGLAGKLPMGSDCLPAMSAPLHKLSFNPSSQSGYHDDHERRREYPPHPKTAGLPRADSFGLHSPRGLPLTPLSTNFTPTSTKSLMVGITLSPSLLQQQQVVDGNSVSPSASVYTSSQSRSSPSIQSPQTPQAMSFEKTAVVGVVSDTTPPLPDLEWLDSRPETMIEEDIQDTTPQETGLPRGREPNRDTRQTRARSVSPPSSAYPKESAFSWETVDLSNRNKTRYATDDDLYCMTPMEAAQQMMEDVSYKPSRIGFDPRLTILGSYFGR